MTTHITGDLAIPNSEERAARSTALLADAESRGAEAPATGLWRAGWSIAL
jgi:hypothetical protein